MRILMFVVIATQLALAGCATPQRLPAVPEVQASQTSEALGPIRYLVSRETATVEAEGRDALVKEQRWLASEGQGPELPPAYLLAVSGGGDNGAYGAGFLNGWTASGTRPQFKVVTGVSTGALIAPFAFLGPKYDYVLQRVYTATSQKDIFKKRGLLKGMFGDAMADTRPLIVAEPMFRAPKPEIVSESNFAGAWAGTMPQSIKAAAVVYIREINLPVMKSFLTDSNLHQAAEQRS